MKEILRNYFTFNKRERNGALVLIFIIVLLLVYLTLSPSLVSDTKIDATAFEKAISVIADTETVATALPNNIPAIISVDKAEPAPSLFDFNPNGLSETDWKRLGLTTKQIKTIKNYEAKGGKFYSKADVKKMYCISDQLYQQLEKYIVIPVNEKITSHNPLPQAIELNTADSITLVKLKGVGPAFAKRILGYRKLLGGFYSDKQLLEVYGMDSAKHEMILHNNRIEIEASKIEPLHINTANVDVLKKHPYIKFQLARLIVNYRLAHGAYKSVDELKKLDLMNETLFLKLKNYITVD